MTSSAIEILSLFLGLVFGPQHVDLAVGAEVRAVELRLDGSVVVERTLTAEEAAGEDRLRLAVDLGPDLLPHELEAVAFDRQGTELGRSRQWLNLPRPRADVRVFLDLSGEEPKGNLTWRAVDFDRPAAVMVTLDGQPVPRGLYTDGSGAILALPSLDLSTFHVLTAEVVFSDDVRARADRVFGGAYGTETSTQLTALLVNSRRRNPERMQGWFRHDGRPLRVVAMEEGRADVIVVRERSEALQRSLEVLGNQALMKVSLSQRARNSGVLRKGDRVRFVMPGWQEGSGGATAADGASNSGSASGSGGGSDSEIMPVDAGKIEVPTLLESITFRWLPGETHLDAQPLAESVAIAGLWAATGNRRTVVVLVRGGDTEDVSRLSPDQVRAYLAALGVPLRVWTLPVGEDRGDPWGDDHDLGNADALVGALAELRYLLEGQFVVWVEGEVPAHRIEITDRARGMKRPR